MVWIHSPACAGGTAAPRTLLIDYIRRGGRRKAGQHYRLASLFCSNSTPTSNIAYFAHRLAYSAYYASMASLPPPRCSADPSGTDVFDTSAATAMHDALIHDTTPAFSSSHSRSRSACSTPSSPPTNAFEGLVAWFCSRDIHPTAKYAWSE